MIRKRAVDGWLLIPQAFHAAVSGQFARWWQSPHFIQAVPREEIELATTLHDSGWAEWDAAPPLHEDGHPVDFREITLADTDAIWKLGIDKVAQKSLYAAVLVSLHASTIYQLRAAAGLDSERVTSDRLNGLDAMRQEIVQELRERGLYPAQQLEQDYLLSVYRILRVCDLLSLALCADELQSGEITDILTPIGIWGKLTYHPVGAQTLRLEPYPFNTPDAQVVITARYLPQTSFPDPETYHEAIRRAEIRQLRFQLVAG